MPFICVCCYHRDHSGHVTAVEGALNLENTEYKDTLKLTWLAKTDHTPATPTVCVHFDNLITKGVLKPEENFKDFVNRNSKVRIVKHFQSMQKFKATPFFSNNRNLLVYTLIGDDWFMLKNCERNSSNHLLAS